jgi:cytochrome c5
VQVSSKIATVRSIRLLGAILANLVVIALFSSTASAQSAADNIRPVGQVCMADQPCVGSKAGGAGSSSAAMATTPRAAAAPAPVPVPAAAPTPAAAPATAAAGFDAATAYQQNCFACHGTGAAGAPKLGDAAAWAARTEKGMDAVMANATNGLNAMPPKGLCMSCSADDLRALVDYMVSESQ